MQFPKYVFKMGTGKVVNANGLVVAESELVESAEALAALGSGWCDSPVGAMAAAAKKEALPAEPLEVTETKPKKAK